MSTESAGPATELRAQLRESPIKPHEIARLLDGMTHAQRVEAVRSLGRAEQRALYKGVEGFRPLSLVDFVPAGRGDLVPVRHYGKNTLPAFTHFEKRFCRPADDDPANPSQLYGFNFQTMSPLTGPGYFVARQDPDRPEVLVDYNLVPPGHPEGWPDVRPNDRGLSRFVYGFMIDTMRGVSEHVSIGSAARRGKDLGSWFILCREE